MDDFWRKLPKPFFALAPLEDVTDAAFRRLIARYGKPDVMFTEFTSADGLFFANPVRSRARASAPEGPLGRATSNGGTESGWNKLQAKLIFSDSERPIVAQLFTSSPERMKKAAEKVAELGFDGIDINMGCPDKAVEKSGCGAALIKNPKLARELIRSAGESGLPVSVKTRIGYAEDELNTWLPELLAENISALTIHARTRKEMSDVPARWDAVARAVKIRDSAKSHTLIIGNGDVRDIADARAKAAKSGADGVMLGRAIFGNPWLFRNMNGVIPESEHTDISVYQPAPREKLSALREHILLFEELLSKTSNYSTLKKHFASYVKGWPACPACAGMAGRDGAKELRMRLMETTNTAEALSVIAESQYLV